jgi:alkaline phosphatase D
MTHISRRPFIEMAMAFGATAAWGRPFAKPSKIAWREQRDLYSGGVASGDPESSSVLLWTRRAPLSAVIAPTKAPSIIE